MINGHQRPEAEMHRQKLPGITKKCDTKRHICAFTIVYKTYPDYNNIETDKACMSFRSQKVGTTEALLEE